MTTNQLPGKRPSLTAADTGDKYAAILSRDKRYDGAFFFAVTTTGIYCLPSCPAPRPLEQNVRFYKTARDAKDAGYRACKRCHPDAPRQNDPSAPEITGMSERHARRRAKQATGLTPAGLRRSKQLTAARTLLTTTSLSVTDIAFNADFSSLRQFNHAFKKAFEVTPRQMRLETASQLSAKPMSLELKLEYKTPMCWPVLVRGLVAHATPNLERYDEAASTLTRYIKEQGAIVKVTLDLHDYHSYAKVQLETEDAQIVGKTASRVRRLLDLDHNPSASDRHLSHDTRLEALVQARPGLRIAGAWDPYELMILTIIGQQISVPAARTIAGRLVAAYGQPHEGLYMFPEAVALAGANAAEMSQKTGINARKVAAIQTFAGLVAAGLDLSRAAYNDDIEQKLLSISGVGAWTVAYVALRGWGNPDAFPSEDLLVKRKLRAASSRQALALGEAWRPFRAYATMHIWAEATYA